LKNFARQKFVARDLSEILPPDGCRFSAYHWALEVAGVTFSGSDSAPVSKFLNPDSGPEIFQI